MRDLTVANVHTYYVVVGATPVLVHNINWCKPSRSTHFADVTVHNSSGSMVREYSVRSGNYTSAEDALGWPRKMIASHTENRIGRMSGGPSIIGITPIVGDAHAGLHPVSPGDYVIIHGRNPICGPCQAALNRAADATGATFVYMWEGKGGAMQWWQSGRPLG
jgi:hypothetical protein